MTSFLSILAKSSGAIDQNLAVDKGNNGDVLISTTTGFSFVSPNTFTPNLSQVLLAGNTATNNINLTGNVSANTFIGNLTGTATTAVNIEGGAGGSIPYQSAANTTALLANGTAGQYLKSLGSTNPPVWDNFPVISPNLSQVLFVGNTATNDINLTGNISATTFIGNLTGIATSATTATTATRATNIAGGSGGSIPYQSAANTTALLANGTAGQVLTSAGTTLAPTWTTPSSGGVSIANTNLLYDDFMSCPVNTATAALNVPKGPMGMAASTTSSFLNQYLGTKIPGRCGIVEMVNPTGIIGQAWDMRNISPYAFDNLAIGASVVPIGLTHKFFADGVYTPQVIQYVGIFSSQSFIFANAASQPPNVFITVNYLSGANGQLNYYVDGVLVTGPITVTMATLTNWYDFGIRRTSSNTFQLLGLFATSGTYSNITSNLFLRCGSYTTANIPQTARIFVDSCNVQLNIR